jgi:hypothetical protein
MEALYKREEFAPADASESVVNILARYCYRHRERHCRPPKGRRGADFNAALCATASV